MLPYEQALERVLAAVTPLSAEAVPLSEVLGRAVAEPVLAPVALPPFDNSMVDGYAVRHASVVNASRDIALSLPIVMEIPAGSWPARALRAGEAARIFTGAPIPEGCDAIVMVEDTEEEGSQVVLRAPGSGGYIRRRGSDLAESALALPAGVTIGSGEVGVLAALNIPLIPCHRKPRIGLLTTGDELVPVGKRVLQPGQIRNSNGPALLAAVTEAGGEVVRQAHALDSPEDLERAFRELAEADVILSTGGVSVGDHDHVKAVLQRQGSLDFWRIAIKPGKPLAFGHWGESLFFGLPGNPVSSLVTFELFVRPVLRKLAGHHHITRPELTVTLTEPLPHAPGRREFVRVALCWENGACWATPTGAQGSHRTHSMVGADALAIAHEDHSDYPAGATLPALLLR